MDSATMTFCSNSICSPPLHFLTAGIRSAQCSFMAGRILSFPRQRFQASRVGRVSGKREGALTVTCRDDKILVANRGEIAVRATAGRGGLGMRLGLAKEPREFVKLLQQAKSGAAAAFGNGGVYLEKYTQNSSHIEFQVLADKYGNAVHFEARDCSIKRRNQKLLDEAPFPALTPELRKAMGDAAVAAAASIGYIGVDTVEFLLDERGSFYAIGFQNGKVDIPKHEQELAAPQETEPTTAQKELVSAST